MFCPLLDPPVRNEKTAGTRRLRRSIVAGDLVLDRAADLAQDLADLAAQEDEGDDRDDRDEREDQGVLSEPLAFLVPIKGGEDLEIHVRDDRHFVPPG